MAELQYEFLYLWKEQYFLINNMEELYCYCHEEQEDNEEFVQDSDGDQDSYTKEQLCEYFQLHQSNTIAKRNLQYFTCAVGLVFSSYFLFALNRYLLSKVGFPSHSSLNTAQIYGLTFFFFWLFGLNFTIRFFDYGVNHQTESSDDNAYLFGVYPDFNYLWIRQFGPMILILLALNSVFSLLVFAFWKIPSWICKVYDQRTLFCPTSHPKTPCFIICVR